MYKDQTQPAVRFALVLLSLIVAWLVPIVSAAAESGTELAAAMQARDEGVYLRQHLLMTMRSKKGHVRRREATYVRASQPNRRQTLIRFTAPARIRDSSFLTHEHMRDKKPDDQWLYLPALRKVRRVSAADRGDHFFGSDFTYEDIKAATKFNLADYNFTLLPQSQSPNLDIPIAPTESHGEILVLQGEPKTNAIARELGYGRIVAWVDSARLIPVRVHYWDLSGSLLKRVKIGELSLADDIWTPQLIEAHNEKTGHKTQFKFSAIEYPTDLPEKLFSRNQLSSRL